jgi:cation diffusion facilitator CzcD-associated flavoprotein CzcO
MATPEVLPLRSDLPFEEESREAVIEGWTTAVGDSVNLRLNAEVIGITGHRDNFEIALAGGEKLTAAHVVLAIGVQGNIRKLAVPGADLPFVQYQLDDPDEYKGEEIVVVGTGDAGLENALGLSANNMVTIINRGPDFPYAKPANVALGRGGNQEGRYSAAAASNSMTTIRSGAGAPSNSAALPPRARKRPPKRAILAAASGRYGS